MATTSSDLRLGELQTLERVRCQRCSESFVGPLSTLHDELVHGRSDASSRSDEANCLEQAIGIVAVLGSFAVVGLLLGVVVFGDGVTAFGITFSGWGWGIVVILVAAPLSLAVGFLLMLAIVALLAMLNVPVVAGRRLARVRRPEREGPGRRAEVSLLVRDEDGELATLFRVTRRGHKYEVSYHPTGGIDLERIGPAGFFSFWNRAIPVVEDALGVPSSQRTNIP